MDTLNLALKLMGKEKTTEERNEAVNPSTASIIHMIAVTPSSGGKVVLMDEIESSADWAEGDYIEIEEDGTFEEYESEDDPLEDVDDSVVDMTDGDGADIEETDETSSVSFSVTDYQAQATEAYATEAAAEEEAEATEDDLVDEDAGITDAIDDGDATELPDDGETSEEDDLADEDAFIAEMTDDEYTLTDDNSDDESDDYVEGAEVSDGYTVAECIGSINAGDRVAVMVQDGKVIVLGVVGSGDEQRANTETAQETADEAIIVSEISQAAAEAAQQAATAAQGKADEAKQASENTQVQAEEAAQAASNAQTQAQNATEQAQAAQSTAATAQTQAAAAQSVADAVKADVEQTNKDLQEYASNLETLSNTMQTDYAKKTELSETEASLQTQISQNAGSIETIAAKVTEVDETVNEAVDEAKKQAATAQQTAQAAQAQAATAQQTADNAQASANTAQAAAEAAQNEADTAQAAAEAARNIADQAETDLETAKQNLAAITSRVDATEDEIAAAEAAVDTAQAAADAAKADAQAAQNTADAAKASATTAQQAADNAKNAANAAQTAADNAKAAADKAQADVDSLAVRVTTAETKILQNAEQISLMATKTEVAKTLGGYYTKTETEAAIKARSDTITVKVSAVESNVDSLGLRMDSAQAALELKVDSETLISEINASADVIRLSGNRFVVDSTNLKITEDGTLIAVNGEFTGTIKSSSGEFTEGFSVKLAVDDSEFFELKMKTDNSIKSFFAGIDSSDDMGKSYLKIRPSYLDILSLYLNISGGRTLELCSGGQITLDAPEIYIADSLYGNHNFELCSTISEIKSELSDHKHYRLYNATLDDYVSYISDSGIGYLRCNTADACCCGSASRPWYKVYTNRLEVLTSRPVFQPTYDNTVSYATNCFIGTGGVLSRTTNTSSKTIKHDIKLLDSEGELSADKLYDIKVYQFKYNDDIITDKEDARYGKDLVGFIIEDLNDKYPIAVDKPSDNVKEWSWNAQYLIPPMLKLIQEQNNRLIRVEAMIESIYETNIEQMAQ